MCGGVDPVHRAAMTFTTVFLTISAAAGLLATAVLILGGCLVMIMDATGGGEA